MKTTMREGSLNSTVFSLVIVCLGAGTLTIPNIMYDNGFYFGSFLIIFGGFLSAFAGYLVAYCAEKTGSSCYEEMALAIFGKRMMKFTSFCMLPCNMGFLASYFVVVSEMNYNFTYFALFSTINSNICPFLVQNLYAILHRACNRKDTTRMVW